MADSSENRGIVPRVRSASVSIFNANPQLGMWQAAGTAIAQAPNLTELRDPESGGGNIEFNAQGHSARFAIKEDNGELALLKSITTTQPPTTATTDARNVTEEESTIDESKGGHDDLRPSDRQALKRRQSLHEKHKASIKEKWGPTVMNGLNAFWKFFRTPSGFIITIYFLNIVAWGAMLFFLLLNAAPAMNHPSANDPSSPRKKWLEIDSQILNALFCVTGFGLAPWRFRDLYLFIRAVHFKSVPAMRKLQLQNKAWFRAPAWAMDAPTHTGENRSATRNTEIQLVDNRPSFQENEQHTFTGNVAPPTPLWKLGFTIWMMVLNTGFQVVLCYFMWRYNRFDRPTWATGTFIGLGCGVAMFAGLMSWWEGRKVKIIEGPAVEIVKSV